MQYLCTYTVNGFINKEETTEKVTFQHTQNLYTNLLSKFLYLSYFLRIGYTFPYGYFSICFPVDGVILMAPKRDLHIWVVHTKEQADTISSPPPPPTPLSLYSVYSEELVKGHARYFKHLKMWSFRVVLNENEDILSKCESQRRRFTKIQTNQAIIEHLQKYTSLFCCSC